jgi:formylglycine-generating enzyme required for sulfatase activity
LVLWSPLSIKSKWVEEESTIGKNRGVLVAAKLSQCEPPFGFTLIHCEELFDPNFLDDDPAWRKVLGSIGRHCRRKDIEEWAKLEPEASAAQLRAWIAAHPDSPASLFLDVDARLRARAVADEKRAREEQEARWRRAIEGLNRQSSSAVRAFREKWPDHPKDEALRLSLPAIELAERQQAEREALERLDKRSSKAVREFLQKLPNHPSAEALRASLPKIEEAERQLAREQEASRERGAKEDRERARQAEANRRANRFAPILLWGGGIVVVLVVVLRFMIPQGAPTTDPRVEPPRSINEFDDCNGAGWCPIMVRIPGRQFAVGKIEVTFGQWVACERAGDCQWSAPEGERNRAARGGYPANNPVTMVNWPDTQEYVQWLSRQTGQNYRLLREAEWEYAAAGSFGLQNMNGGVEEWLHECQSAGDCNHQLVRGGDGDQSYYPFVGVSNGERGFRVARALSTAESEAPAEASSEDGVNQAASEQTLTSRILGSDEDANRLLAGTVFRDCADCPEMVLIAAGSFKMGSPDSDRDWAGDSGLWSRPQRRVNVRQFAIGQFELTFDQWAACASAGGCTGNANPYDADWGRGNRPVIHVSWDDAQEYVRWLSQFTGQTYRLPNEAEWEYSARAGADMLYPWGDTRDDAAASDYANYNYNFTGSRDHWANTSPVGSFPANAFGLYDMHGNVWEWVQDCPGRYDPTKTDGAAVEVEGCERRIMRGSAHNIMFARTLRTATRMGQLTRDRYSYQGFRVARTV